MRTWVQIPRIHVKACQLCVTIILVSLQQDGRHPGESLQAYRPTILVQAKANKKRHLKHCGRWGLPTEAIYWHPTSSTGACLHTQSCMYDCVFCLMVHSHNISLLPSDILPMFWVYRILLYDFLKVIPNAGSKWHLNKHLCLHIHTYMNTHAHNANKSPCMYNILKRKFKYKITT